MKEKLKKVPLIMYFWSKYKNLRDRKEFKYDRKHFSKYYINKLNSKEKIEYSLLLLTHQIEKGLSANSKRRFGKDKICNIINLLKKYLSITSEKSYAFNLSMSCLEEYLKQYEDCGWINTEEYILVNQFLQKNISYDKINFGVFEFTTEDLEYATNIDYLKFLDSRHSIRDFDSRELLLSDISKAVDIALRTPTACNRQMCKIYFVKNTEKKELIKKYAQGLSLFELNNINYFLITFDNSAFRMVGERNQGYFNAGLIATNFINALHSLGIGTCFIQFGNSYKEEKIIKNELNIPDRERIAIIITAGYYKNNNKALYSTRKDINDIYIII